MITAKCPVCLSPGLRLSWEHQGEDHVVYSFLCSDVSCPRARDPWYVIEPLGGARYSMLERLRDFARLASLFSYVVLGGVKESLVLKARRPLRRIRRWVWSKSNFSDPKMVLVHEGGNRRWIRVEEHEEIVDQLEELQEASR